MKNILIVILLLASSLALAHDKRHTITPQQKEWFDKLRSGIGPCCSDADGSVLKDVDWETKDGHYRVRINEQWIDVPDEAIIKEPNLYGPTMVWAMTGWSGTRIQCFMPGVMM